MTNRLTIKDPNQRSGTTTTNVRAGTFKRDYALLLGVVFIPIACQIGLLFDGLAPYRILFRIAAFAVSLVCLIIVGRIRRRHISQSYAAIVLCIIGAEYFHPNTSSGISAVATLALYAAIISPIFWATGLDISPREFAHLITIMWAFHTVSSVFGVLQTYYPGQFQPSLSKVVVASQYRGDNLKVTLANGESIYRPMGLTDMPGGASNSGAFAFLFGLGLFSTSRRQAGRIGGLASMPLGLFCIYLSQVRSHLVICGILVLSLLAALLSTRRYASALRVASVVPAVAVGAFIWAIAMGGDSTSNRFQTLVNENPNAVYYKNRGALLEDTFTQVAPLYPVGAGLGRWGMINVYFSDRTNRNASPLWVEIQWTGWIVDGGWLLVAAYLAAILAAVFSTWRVAIACGSSWLAEWALVIAAFDIATLALTFNAAPFIGQTGMEFWLLNGAVYAASHWQGLADPAGYNKVR